MFDASVKMLDLRVFPCAKEGKAEIPKDLCRNAREIRRVPTLQKYRFFLSNGHASPTNLLKHLTAAPQTISGCSHLKHLYFGARGFCRNTT
jgi:hypothetical protein